VADTHGIVYTPQEIVDFMCASVAEVLEAEFGKKLGDPGVHILDPCTGTGNFIVNLVGRIPKRHLPRMYREQLFANEVMLMPYYIAALNIEHAYYEATGEYEPFEGLCFVDTLDLAEAKQGTFPFMTERNTERVRRQKDAPITVVIGNPPYNVGQLHENDNNKNRKYPVVDDRIKCTYVRDSSATLRMQLYDPYVRFFRWATDRLEGRDGIVCLVTNNSFVDQIAFDGMRKHVLADFNCVYHLDLRGNVRHNPRLSGSAYNVFGIQVGVGITVAVRCAHHRKPTLMLSRVDELVRREHKLAWLRDRQKLSNVNWDSISADQSGTWRSPAHRDEFESCVPMGAKRAVVRGEAGTDTMFRLHANGVKTNADVYLHDFDRSAVEERARRIAEDYNSQLDRWKRHGHPRDLGSFLRIDEKVHKWIRNTKRTLQRGDDVHFSSECIRRCLYRPFSRRFYYFEKAFNEDLYRFPTFLPSPATESENQLLCVSAVGSERPFYCMASNTIVNLSLVGFGGGCQCFPFYTYAQEGTNRRDNITDWALKHFRDHYGNRRITKWDIFYYVYGILHHPAYRERYADNLKRELPRIPLAPDFRAFSSAGKALAALHLDYEELEPYELEWVETPDVPLSYRVEKMRLAKDKRSLRVNDSLTLAGIPPEVFEYRLGNRSALDWVIDQYRVKTDKRSGITSDPNRPDDPEYIVRLVGQVVDVSLETVKIVAALPDDFGAPK